MPRLVTKKFSRAKLDELLEQERNEQRASFVFGQLALMRRYQDATPAELEELRRLCRKAAGLE